MAEPYIGEIRMFAGNYAPVGWALCNGQLMAISQNTALFSLLGAAYTRRAPPPLRGRRQPVHVLNRAGSTPRCHALCGFGVDPAPKSANDR